MSGGSTELNDLTELELYDLKHFIRSRNQIIEHRQHEKTFGNLSVMQIAEGAQKSMDTEPTSPTTGYDPPDIEAAKLRAKYMLRQTFVATEYCNLARAFLATLDDLDQAERERDVALLGGDDGKD